MACNDATPKFDNRKKIDFLKTIIDFWKKNEINIPNVDIAAKIRFSMHNLLVMDE